MGHIDVTISLRLKVMSEGERKGTRSGGESAQDGSTTITILQYVFLFHYYYYYFC